MGSLFVLIVFGIILRISRKTSKNCNSMTSLLKCPSLQHHAKFRCSRSNRSIEANVLVINMAAREKTTRVWTNKCPPLELLT